MLNHKLRFLFLILFVNCSFLKAQPIKPMPTGEILLNLKKLNILGSALYVAAHPDDENTIMLSWLAKERKVRTSYLSVTRGDGGQNLVGSELSDLLGLIRTQELLAARAIDGPEQYFTRANDFGFSKNTDETMQIWGKEAVLGDVVWRIRNLRPDVIICRFPPDSRAGHGNHSSFIRPNARGDGRIGIEAKQDRRVGQNHSCKPLGEVRTASVWCGSKGSFHIS